MMSASTIETAEAAPKTADLRSDTLPGHRAIDARALAAFEALVDDVSLRLKGVIGVGARHLETGLGFSVNGAERFPMASTYKVPIAAAFLAKVDRGDLTLDQRIEIEQRHVQETGPIAQSIRHPGASVSTINLLELMLTQSNNNATDRVLELIGGPTSVTAWLRSIGVTDMRVDSTVNDILNRFFGFEPFTAAHDAFLERFSTDEARERASGTAQAAFDAGLEDTTTPDAMMDLLARLFAGDLLSARSRTLLIEIMQRCETGNGRLRGLLPPGVVVADKTGSVGGTINDVGMIMLPNGRGRLVIAVLTKQSPIVSYPAREPVIAEIARSAFDYFAFR